MKAALSAMQVRAAKSGVGQYIYALLDSMLPMAPSDRFQIYCTAENIGNYTWPRYPNAENTIWGLAERKRSFRLGYEAVFFPGELSKTKPDVFHGPSNFVPRQKVCPYVVTIQDLSYYIHPKRTSFVRRQYWYIQTRRTVRIADRIISISENTKRDILRFFPEAESKITVIPLAAHRRFCLADISRENSEISRFEEKIQGKPFILYVGTLEPGKNVERIIRGFDAVAGDFPDVQLVLAGDRGWLFGPIFEALETARHRERIHYLGHVKDEEVVDLFRFCEAFVYPSHYEGFGLPPLEAMACGAPVITSNTSSLPEVVGDAALKVTPTNQSELETAMRNVLGDAGLRASLRQAGLVQASRFSWERTAEETLKVYRETAGKALP